MPSHCLLIIDMVNDFLDRWQPDRAALLVRNINLLVRAFHDRGLPVVWVKQELKADLQDAPLEVRDTGIPITIEGTRGSEISSALEKYRCDPVVIKKRYSAFFQTPLLEMLTRMNPHELVICGINTHACVRMTAIDAYQNDYRVVLATECTDSYDTEHAAVSLRYMRDKIARARSNAEIIADLRELDS